MIILIPFLCLVIGLMLRHIYVHVYTGKRKPLWIGLSLCAVLGSPGYAFVPSMREMAYTQIGLLVLSTIPLEIFASEFREQNITLIFITILVLDRLIAVPVMLRIWVKTPEQYQLTWRQFEAMEEAAKAQQAAKRPPPP